MRTLLLASLLAAGCVPAVQQVNGPNGPAALVRCHDSSACFTEAANACRGRYTYDIVPDGTPSRVRLPSGQFVGVTMLVQCAPGQPVVTEQSPAQANRALVKR